MPIFHKCRPGVHKLVVRFGVLLLSTFGILTTAQAGPRDDTLYWSSAATFENLSPYYDFRPEGLAFKHLVWDSLFYREPNKPEFKPLLATKLKWIGTTTVEIELRQGVVFHNGDRFTADDILETVRRLKDPNAGLPRHRAIRWIGDVEKLGSHKVRFNLKRPTPNLMELLSGPFVVVPKATWANAPLDDNGRPDYRRMDPVGSGPYRVTRIEPDSSVEVEIFRRYFKGPKSRSLIRRIKFETVEDSGERLSQLLNGRLDFIWRISKSAHERLGRKGVPIQLLRSPSLRIAFLVMDRAGRNDEKSPLRDVRVRRAIAHSINRAEIARKVFGSRSNVLQALCHPAQIGCFRDVRSYEYSPETARKLLSSAGYGPAGKYRIIDKLNNLATRLPGKPPEKMERPRSIVSDILSYRNHAASLDMTLYLKAVGIDSRVEEYAGYERALANLKAGRVDLAHMTWASHGSFDLADLLNPLFRNGFLDFCGDAEINRWLDVAENTNDRKVRNLAFRNILVRLQDIACVLPLFSYTTFYAFSKRLEFTPALDDVPRFYNTLWK